MSCFVFGYGSLINPHSIGSTIMRVPEQVALRPSRLRGYERLWDYRARVRIEGSGAELDAAFLNLRACPEAVVNGVVFRVTDAEMDLLATRERFYTKLDVTDGLDDRVDGRVFTFVCSDPDHMVKEGEQVSVLERYVVIVHDGCAGIGPQFAEEFGRTTRPVVFPVVPGMYRFLP